MKTGSENQRVQPGAPPHPPHVLRVFVAFCAVFAGAALGELLAAIRARTLVVCRTEREEVKLLQSLSFDIEVLVLIRVHLLFFS